MDREEYLREYQKDKYAAYKQERHDLLARVFDGRCWLCGSTKDFESFQLHHKEYHPEESAYDRQGKSQWNRVQRLQEAKAHPERFALLCEKCHRIVGTLGTELRTLRRKHIDLDKLVVLIRLEADNRTD